MRKLLIWPKRYYHHEVNIVIAKTFTKNNKKIILNVLIRATYAPQEASERIFANRQDFLRSSFLKAFR